MPETSTVTHVAQEHAWLDLAEEALTRVDGRRSADLLRQFDARRCASAATWATEHLGWI
jgi:hypothetical protein